MTKLIAFLTITNALAAATRRFSPAYPLGFLAHAAVYAAVFLASGEAALGLAVAPLCRRWPLGERGRASVVSGQAALALAYALLWPASTSALFLLQRGLKDGARVLASRAASQRLRAWIDQVR